MYQKHHVIGNILIGSGITQRDLGKVKFCGLGPDSKRELVSIKNYDGRLDFELDKVWSATEYKSRFHIPMVSLTYSGMQSNMLIYAIVRH